MIQLLANDDIKWRKIALKICRCEDLAGDLVQSMYIKVYEHLQKYPSTKISPSYVYIVIRNIYFDHLEQENKKTRTIPDHIEPEEETEKRKKVHNVLMQLPFLEREVLITSKEKSMRQISRESGATMQEIRTIKERATQKFIKKWEENQED